MPYSFENIPAAKFEPAPPKTKENSAEKVEESPKKPVKSEEDETKPKEEKIEKKKREIVENGSVEQTLSEPLKVLPIGEGRSICSNCALLRIYDGFQSQFLFLHQSHQQVLHWKLFLLLHR